MQRSSVSRTFSAFSLSLLTALAVPGDVLSAGEPADLVSLWAGEGNAQDSVGTNNATLSGKVTFAGGRVGQAFSFDGTGGYVAVADSPELEGLNENTLMAWVLLDALPSATGFNYIAGRSGVANDYDLEIEDDNRIRFYPCGGAGGGGFLGSTTLVHTGVWYHVAATYKAADRMRLFVNGTAEVDVPISCIQAENHAPFTIGFSPLWQRPFHGRIDQIRFYRRALNTSEIEQIYLAESGQLPATALSIRVSQVELCFETTPGVWYQVQYQSALTSGDWLPLVTNVFQGAGGIFCTNDSVRVGEPHKFYRLFVTNAPPDAVTGM